MAMSRAATAGVGMMGGVVGLTFFLMSRGLPEDARKSVDQVDGWIKAAQAEVASEQARLETVVAEDKAFLSARPEVKAARAGYAARLAAIDKIGARVKTEIDPILKADDYGDRLKLQSTLTSIEAALQRTPREFPQLLSNVFRVRNYKRDHKSLVEGARVSVRNAAKDMADPTLQAAVSQAQIDYPDASERLQARVEALQKKRDQVAAALPELEAAAQANPIDYVKAGTLAEALQKDARGVSNGVAKLRADIASLSKSTDKILVDMKKVLNDCYHKYRYVEGGLARQTDWVPVACVDYVIHQNHLGMAIYSKPEGTFESEAVTVAHPPGYNYIGNTRYGRWDERAGGRYWVWYGQYALTRDLLWGVGGYRPVRDRSWSSYRSSVKSRKPYFGATKQYGTNGSLTKTKYKSSAFLTKRRATFAASKYRSSQQPKYNSTRSGSTYRSNRYRSSSFGGSGK